VLDEVALRVAPADAHRRGRRLLELATAVCTSANGTPAFGNDFSA
jgi:hypothetical protein